MPTRVMNAAARVVRRGSLDWLGAAGIALAATSAAILLRLGIEQLVKDVVIFALVFPAVALATFAGGWRAGLLTTLMCQLLTWYFILPVQQSFRFESVGNLVSLVLTTLVELLLVWSVHIYQQAARALLASREARAAELQLALRELDHRSMNNFTLASAMLRLQARRVAGEETATALGAASDRLHVLALAHRKLSASHLPDGETSLTARPLAPLLAEILDGLRLHLPENVVLLQKLEPISVSHENAIRIGLILNELVTNAIKHAFPGRAGTIDVRLATEADHLELSVCDDGVGRGSRPESGLGTGLLQMLAKAVGGEILYENRQGTTVRFRILRGPLALHTGVVGTGAG